ncbi:MAG TPA: Lrp/AsnC family transcriptional regulator [Anaerolineales bacterium]|nr:Lrp/AsnC family transcriptional regulator [Anaerolineales bacterium]
MSNPKENQNNEKISDIDLQILNFLRKDGRMPFAQIAKQLNVSTGMVRIHYQKLVEKGALQIAAITNPMYIGRSKMAMIGIRVDGSRLKEIIKEISAFEEVIYLVFLTGNYDLLAEVVCKDKEHLLNFLTEKLYKVKGVRNSETFMYLDIIKEDYI